MSSSSQANALRNSGAPSGFGDGTRARKGSIRNAVRKIFGRRSRDTISQFPADVETSSASHRHAYHKSEPPAPLPPQPELPEPQVDDNIVPRTLSNSYQADRPSFSRTTSPYALQFPNSVRLKPMDLSSHFASPPQALRRRKTLPSMLAEEGGTTDDQPSAEESDTDLEARQAKAGESSTVKSVADRVKKDRRKSRSTDDLQAATTREQSVPRKRSEEIRYWRESFRPDVLRASGFTAQSASRDRAAIMRPNISRGSERESVGHEQEVGLAESIPRPSEQYEGHSKPATLKSSPPRQPGAAISFTDDYPRPSSGVGTEMSRDLEDRVAKLEAGLQTFQKSLQKLTADRNRRTIVMGGGVTTKGSSGDMRTPSLLADTLAGALEPSGYEYEYGHTIRPSTSPQPPLPASVQGRVEDPFGPELSTPGPRTSHAGPLTSHAPSPSRMWRTSEARPKPVEQERALTPQTTSATMAAVTPGTNGSGGAAQPQQYTFRSLYQMLADERSARRKLENQLKGLRQEISDLHSQVNSTSNQESTRSSYMLAGSSSRLQDILRETGEGSPPDASPRSLKRQSALSAQSSGGAPVISRFSGSDSEALTQDFGQDHDDLLETPYSDYQTPREGRSKWSLAEKLDADTKDNDMF
ncbi:hypothetical protein Slin15195_G012200 [Septoria linicola]|uniref:Uncharacterized protein n=1 Tax=Septoria linicola TaxID=215465 RepID=A0A9Q9AL09_9PEZI|nr:hypothetical protein Slin14017_G012220 [Septoria linicola]USW47901.1 hypothetical protein Slin15195_G012200 [Septoria linicola]